MACHLQTEDWLAALDPSVRRISSPVYGLVVSLYATRHDRSAPELALFASKVLDEEKGAHQELGRDLHTIDFRFLSPTLGNKLGSLRKRQQLPVEPQTRVCFSPEDFLYFFGFSRVSSTIQRRQLSSTKYRCWSVWLCRQIATAIVFP